MPERSTAKKGKMIFFLMTTIYLLENEDSGKHDMAFHHTTEWKNARYETKQKTEKERGNT
jgi:hypothetical protein